MLCVLRMAESMWIWSQDLFWEGEKIDVLDQFFNNSDSILTVKIDNVNNLNREGECKMGENKLTFLAALSNRPL
jgi:hypothetical protein